MKTLLLPLLICGIAGCGGGPISEAQAQAEAKIEVAQIFCIIRPDASGRWYVQNDIDHHAQGCNLNLEQGGDYLRLYFNRQYTHAGTVQISSDDDFRSKVQGFGNLGLTSTTIKIECNGQVIDPATVYNCVPPGGGNLWINITMVNK